MSLGLGILAGAAGAFPAIQRGIDDQRARQQQEEEQAYQREQRANAREDRAFGLGQRQRAVAEQQRQDAIRAGLSAVPQTREVDARPQAVREITVDDDGNPSATQLPAMKTVAAPDWQKFKSTADVFRKNGEVEKADAYEQLANRAQFADSARRFQTVAAGAGTMSLEQLAQAAAEVYNSDPLPAQISGLKPVEGGLQFSFTNSDTGKSQTLVVKSKEELLQKLESYYSPDTYAAAMQARREAAEKAQAKLLEPRELSPGQIQVSGGKVIARNDNPTEAQIRAAGGEGGASGARGGKAADPMKDIDEAVDFIAKSSSWKDQGATAADVSRFRRLARQFYDESRAGGGAAQLDASRAAEAAAIAVTQPEKLQLNFDPKTGQIVRALDMEGSKFTIERLGPPNAARGLKKEELEQLARDQLAAAPVDLRALYLGAAKSPQDLKQTLDQVDRETRSRAGLEILARAYGREPTKEEVDAAVKSTQRRIKAYGDLFSTHLPKDLINPPKREPKKGAAAGLGFDWQVEPGLGSTAAEMLNAGT